MKIVPFILLPVLVLGCASKPEQPAPEPPKPVDLSRGASLFPRDRPPGDAQPEPMLVVNLTVYRMLVPVRSVSHDENFWKHVDEQAVDPETYAKLYLNGVRVGVAPRYDWDYFRKILEN